MLLSLKKDTPGVSDHMGNVPKMEPLDNDPVQKDNYFKIVQGPDLSAIKTRLDKCISEINRACNGVTEFPIKIRFTVPPKGYDEQELLRSLCKKAGWDVSLSNPIGPAQIEWSLTPQENLIRKLYLAPDVKG